MSELWSMELLSKSLVVRLLGKCFDPWSRAFDICCASSVNRGGLPMDVSCESDKTSTAVNARRRRG